MVENNPGGKKKRFLGTLKGKWEDNVRMEYKEIKWDSKDWTHLALGTEKFVRLLWIG